jgi:hypothetical protein
MSLHINYSAEDFIKAQILHWKHSFFGLKFARVLLVCGLATGIIYAFLAHYAGAGARGITLAAIGGFVAVVAILTVVALFKRYFLLPHSARKAMVQLKEFQGQWEFAVADHKLSIKTPRGEAFLPFTDFSKWSENDSAILLYRTDRMFNFIPTQQVDAEFLQILRTELAVANVSHANFRNS